MSSTEPWRVRRIPAIVSIGTVTLASFVMPAAAAPWVQTTDRGQPVPRAKQMALGDDVVRTVGLPRGVPIGGAVLDARTEALSSRMRCPVCQGNAVSDSPSEAARNMKSQVRAMIAAGYDEDQIFRYFESSYGEFIRLMPRPQGLNLLVWALPLSALVLGLVAWVILVVRRRGVVDPIATQASGGVDRYHDADALDPWIAQVREEVARKDV